MGGHEKVFYKKPKHVTSYVTTYCVVAAPHGFACVVIAVTVTYTKFYLNPFRGFAATGNSKF